MGPGHRRHHVPPDRDLRDGRRRRGRMRPRAAGAGRGRSAGGGRVGDAGDAAGQHQRPHHRRGRTRRRPHPRRHAPVGPGTGARAGLVRSCAVAQPAVLDRRHAVGGPEGAAEVGGVGQPPAGGDGAHRPGRQRRVQEVVAAPLQPSLPDQAGHAGPLLVEQLVQRAERDVVGPGDGRRREPGVGQPALDEGVHPQQQCPPGAVRRHLLRAVEAVGQGHREQVERGRADPGPHGRVDRVDQPLVQWAGRERSTKAKSPPWRRAWRPSCSTTTSPWAITSTLQRSASSMRTWRRRRSAPPGREADSSPTRIAPSSAARTWSGTSFPSPTRTSSGPSTAPTTSWTYSARARTGTSPVRNMTVMVTSSAVLPILARSRAPISPPAGEVPDMTSPSRASSDRPPGCRLAGGGRRLGEMTVVFQASDDQPIVSRLERWRHVVDETFGPALLRPPSRTHVPQQLVVGDVGAVRVSELRIAYPTASADRCQAARTPRLIRQSDPDPERYRVDLLVRGQLVVEQAGREAALEPGDFALVDWSRPARWATASERSVSLMFPRALLALPYDEVARLGGVRISGRHGAGALFSSLARQVVAHLDDYGVADGARLGTTLVDLLTAALAAHLDRAGELPADTRQEALRRRVHAFIEQRLADPACPRRRSPAPTMSRCGTC